MKENVVISESSFYERLKDLSQKIGKSLNQIERELNYPRNGLNNYKGKHVPSAVRLLELAEYFGVSSEYLLGKKDKIKQEPLSVENFFRDLNTEQKKRVYELSSKWLISKLK